MRYTILLFFLLLNVTTASAQYDGKFAIGSTIEMRHNRFDKLTFRIEPFMVKYISNKWGVGVKGTFINNPKTPFISGREVIELDEKYRYLGLYSKRLFNPESRLVFFSDISAGLAWKFSNFGISGFGQQQSQDRGFDSSIGLGLDYRLTKSISLLLHSKFLSYRTLSVDPFISNIAHFNLKLHEVSLGVEGRF